MALDVWVIDFKVFFRKPSFLFPFAAVYSMWEFHAMLSAIVTLRYFVFVSFARIWPCRMYCYLWIVFFLVILIQSICQYETPSASQASTSPKLETLLGVFHSHFLQ